TWYLRNTYLENRLCEPGHIQINGTGIDLTSLDMPTYVFASRDDHIVPWQSAYASCGLLTGQRRVVLGASGHIAGVVNPPVKKRRSYWVAPGQFAKGDPAPHQDDWLENAAETAGSWWPDWAAWLAGHAGNQRKAPAKPGNARYQALEPAPGS